MGHIPPRARLTVKWSFENPASPNRTPPSLHLSPGSPRAWHVDLLVFESCLFSPFERHYLLQPMQRKHVHLAIQYGAMGSAPLCAFRNEQNRLQSRNCNTHTHQHTDRSQKVHKREREKKHPNSTSERWGNAVCAP